MSGKYTKFVIKSVQYLIAASINQLHHRKPVKSAELVMTSAMAQPDRTCSIDPLAASTASENSIKDYFTFISMLLRAEMNWLFEEATEFSYKLIEPLSLLEARINCVTHIVAFLYMHSFRMPLKAQTINLNLFCYTVSTSPLALLVTITES